MVKVYIDWNVMSGMKNGHFPELCQIIEKSNNLLLLYSTSHIGDILASYSEDESQKKIIEEDLKFITNLINDLCAFTYKDKMFIDYTSPKELLKERIESASLFDDFNIDSLFKSIEEDENLKGIFAPYIKLLKSFPLEDSFKEAFNQPESAEMMNRMFPGLKNEMTMDGYFKAFGKMYKDLNEKEDYKHLREDVQKIGINSGHFNQGKNPFELIDRASEKFGLSNFDSKQYFSKNKNVPEWFNEITDAYLKLDMYGYKSDKIKVTEKKKSTFKNTVEDAQHSAFASRCEFYITQDERNFKKTKAVFKELEIITYVLKPTEFVDFYRENLDYSGFDEHMENVIDIIKKGEGFQRVDYEESDDCILVHHSQKFIFDFFNRIMLPKGKNDSDTLFMLTKDNPSKLYYIVQNELEGMIKILVDRLGPDDNGNSYYQFDEIKEKEWPGRIWTFDSITIKLIRLNGWFQFYYFTNN